MSLRRKTSSRTTPFPPTVTTQAGKCLEAFEKRAILSAVLFSDALVKSAVGTTHFDGVTYSTTAETLYGVMVDGTDGVNHGTPI